MSEKIQKVLARTGLGSRRKIEEWIRDKRIAVNDKVAKIGQRITVKDSIKLDGKIVKITKSTSIKTKVLIYRKPLGEICTRYDKQGRPTVFRNLPKLETGRWISVGRLDINSEGLLLFTNDGGLANALMHPKSGLEREYLVRVHGKVTQNILKDLKKGIELEDGMAKFTSIKQTNSKGSNQWFRVTVTEGRNRLVRRLWNAKKIEVNRLIRIRFCAILLPRSLPSGDFKELGTKDVEMLHKIMED